MVLSRFAGIATVTAAAAGLALSVAAANDAQLDRVIIHAAKPYEEVVAAIQSAGGQVRHQFKYIDAIAAEVPRGAEATLRQRADFGPIVKDGLVSAPASMQLDRVGSVLDRHGLMQTAEVASMFSIDGDNLSQLALANPDAYLINNVNMNVSPLIARGLRGNGVIVAVIDSGIRPGFPHLESDGSVIGGEDFVGDGLGFSNPLNGGHGTFVAGMISASVGFGFPSTSRFARSVSTHCPGCIIPAPLGTTGVAMVGTAPGASIYALRVFSPEGGSDTSTILRAVERVIELKEKFDAGQRGGRNIQVCNMSLGGATLFAARDLLDTEVSIMLDKGIVLTTSAGNAGPSSLTVGSPGTALETLTVGASSDPIHERIGRDIEFGLGIGALYRPSPLTQTAFFSSRGPSADGRPDPDVVANGDFSFGQGFGPKSQVGFASGTSFSSPSVAGIAALLRESFPSASARQIRNAIVMSANPDVLGDDSTELDQGSGFVDATAAYDLLAAHRAPDTTAKPHHPTPKVANNVRHGTSLAPLKGVVQEALTDLKPGERADFLYQVTDDTGQILVQLRNVTPGATQNLLFGDDILLAVHSAKTSAIGDAGDYVSGPFFTIGGTFVVDDPEPGLLRVTVDGDWTNASAIAADVTIVPVRRKEPRQVTARTRVRTDQSFIYQVNIPAGTALANFALRWKDNWSHYPTSDLDLILVDPKGGLNIDGASLNSPEIATVAKPAAGVWTVIVDGFEVPASFDIFELQVLVDGAIAKPL